MKIRNFAVFSLLYLACSSILINTLSAQINEKKIRQAMRDEIRRTLDSLSVPGLEKPYYVEYLFKQTQAYQLKASFGALTTDENSAGNTVTAGIRVGSPAMDNTNFFDVALSFFGSGDDEERFKNRRMPLEPTYSNVRHSLWLATDAAYKQAAELFSKKQAALKNRILQDTIADFSIDKSSFLADTTSIPTFDTEKYKSLVQKVSAVFAKYPKVMLSSVGIEFTPKRTIYVNSEGREFLKTDLFCGLEIIATSQSSSGMPIAETYSAYGFTPQDLPSQDSLLRVAQSLSEYITQLSAAPTIQAYSGPVLFQGQASAEIFAQSFVPNIVTQRAPLTDRGVQDNGRFMAFQNKIGGRVLPEFLSMLANPLQRYEEKVPLVGSYPFDDEGTTAQNITVIDKGYLKTLLTGRIPTKRLKSSNGHSRGGAPMFSNIRLISEKSKQTTFEELKKKMLKLCKDRDLPYGIIVRKVLNQNLLFTTIYSLTNGEFPSFRGDGIITLLEVVKVYQNGREEVVRGTEAAGMSASIFKDIVAVSNKYYTHNFLASAVTSPFMTGGSQFIGASISVPDVLLEDVEIRPIEGDFSKPPVLENPLFAKDKE